MRSRAAISSGVSKLTTLVFATLIFVVLYCGYHIIPFYYYFFELQNQMATVIRVASTHTDQELRQKLMYHIKKMEIPMEPEDLLMEREGRHMRISLEYEETFYVTFQDKDYEIYTFPFHAYAEGDF